MCDKFSIDAINLIKFDFKTISDIFEIPEGDDNIPGIRDSYIYPGFKKIVPGIRDSYIYPGVKKIISKKTNGKKSVRFAKKLTTVKYFEQGKNERYRQVVRNPDYFHNDDDENHEF